MSLCDNHGDDYILIVLSSEHEESVQTKIKRTTCMTDG